MSSVFELDRLMTALYKLRKTNLPEDKKLIVDMYIDSLQDDDSLLDDAKDFISSLTDPEIKQYYNIDNWDMDL